MAGLPQIGNWGADFGNSMANLGGALGTFINPHQDAQARLKKALAEDPTLMQKFVDMDALDPGSVARMFPWAKGLGVGGKMSSAAEMEQGQRGLAGKSVKDVTETDTVAAQTFLNKNDIGDKNKQTAAAQMVKMNEQTYAQRKLEHEKNTAIYEATKHLIPQAARTELENNLATQGKQNEEIKVATETLKKYGDKLAEVADNIGRMRAGGKFAKEYIPSFAETNALENTNQGFKDAIRAATERYANDLEFARNKELRKTSLADRKEMLAQNRAQKYSDMAAAQGIPDADPVAMYEVFLKGYDAAKKDTNLKPMVDIIDRVNKAQGSMITSQLYGNVAKAAAKIAGINERLKKSKGSVAADDIEEATVEFNMQADNYREHLKMTGQQPENLKQLQAVTVEGYDSGWNPFKSDKPARIDIRAAATDKVGSNTDKVITAFKAGTITKAQIMASPALTPDEKKAILSAIEPVKTPRL